jgi:hypothetical protein
MRAKLFAAGILFLASAAGAADDLKVTVKVVAAQPAVDALVEREDVGQSFALGKDATSGAFVGAIPADVVRDIAAGSKLVAPHRLVVSWADGREQLYLGLKYPVPPNLRVSVYRDQASFDDAAINAIDKLDNDLESSLQKYFRARAFHKHWRFDVQDPENYLAIRSARIWFDAAANLAKRVNSPFRLDPDVVEIMQGYEVKAKTDSYFRQRYRRFAGEGYIAGTVAQTIAADFAFVGAIPDLKAAGRVDEARMLNLKAINALDEATPDVKAYVLKHQRVNMELLQANQKVLNAE